MKLQYLGDSKDSFKWDYHHFLIKTLKLKEFSIAWNISPDDNSHQGKSAPSEFPADQDIISLCHEMKLSRNYKIISKMSVVTRSNYVVNFHPLKNPKIKSHQLLFLDPDKGFAPLKTTNDNYIKYEEVNDLVKKMPSSSVVTVFQHHRRIKFQDDFNKIKAQIDGLTQAIFWKNVMFIAITKSEKMNLRIKNENMKYGKTHPIGILS